MYYPRLRDLREDNDLVQKEVAALLGIDQRVYSNYETGKREIPTRFVVILADFYKTSTDYILGITDETKPYDKNEHGKFSVLIFVLCVLKRKLPLNRGTS